MGPLEQIVMLFPSMVIRLSYTGLHCDHTVHFIADLSLWLDSAICSGQLAQFLCLPAVVHRAFCKGGGD